MSSPTRDAPAASARWLTTNQILKATAIARREGFSLALDEETLGRLARDGRHVVKRQWRFQLPDSWRVQLLLAVVEGDRVVAQEVTLDIAPQVLSGALKASLPAGTS